MSSVIKKNDYWVWGFEISSQILLISGHKTLQETIQTQHASLVFYNYCWLQYEMFCLTGTAVGIWLVDECLLEQLNCTNKMSLFVYFVVTTCLEVNLNMSTCETEWCLCSLIIFLTWGVFMLKNERKPPLTLSCDTDLFGFSYIMCDSQFMTLASDTKEWLGWRATAWVLDHWRLSTPKTSIFRQLPFCFYNECSLSSVTCKWDVLCLV